jgi:hypothetical protein
METVFTTTRRAFDVAEWVTTGVAVVISTTLYLRNGHPYLARGVVGDLLGFALLAGVLAVRRRRARHEALVCLMGIGVVWSVRPAWPLSFSSNFWWGAVVLGLAIYLGIRQRILAQA